MYHVGTDGWCISANWTCRWHRRHWYLTSFHLALSRLDEKDSDDGELTEKTYVVSKELAWTRQGQVE